MSGKEMGLWYAEQRRLNTMESRCSKLLKYIYKANAHLGPGQQTFLTSDFYLSPESIKSPHVSKQLQGFLFSAYYQMHKPTQKRHATRRLKVSCLSKRDHNNN